MVLGVFMEILAKIRAVHKGRLAAACFFFAAFLCFAGELTADKTVSVHIRYYDKRIYYAEGEPVYVLVSVENNTPAVYRFRIADDRAFSVDFDTRSRANRPLDAAPGLLRKRGSAGHIFFRDISIEPGEAFSFVENLRDYTVIDAPGSFVVQAKVYPELLSTPLRQFASGKPPAEAAAPLVSNRLSLQIKPRIVTGEDGLPVELDIETGAALQRDKLAPDQIISWTLRARQKSEWEKFFLYLDIEKMIARDGTRQRRWRAESEEGRRRMTADYRRDLQKASIDGDVSAIPSTFEIERTNYGANEGTVVVLEKFKTGDYTERKRYTYYLEKDDEYWSIVDYTVTNLGTE